MSELIEIIVLLVGFFAAWNIGANDTANCIGVAVGGHVISYRRAIAIVILFVVLGATLEGWKNMTTVGRGIIIPGPGGANPLSAVPLATVAALVSAALWVFAATMFGLPVSASQAMVGAVIGAGLLITITQPSLGASIQYSNLGAIGISWVMNPIFAAIFAFTALKIIGASLKQIKNIVRLNQVLSILVLVAAAYTAYALGANDVGASTGAIYAFFGGAPQTIALFGAIGLAVGAITFSRRVMQTVGMGITELDPATAFAAQFGAAITVWSFVQFGMPVSTAQAIIGAVAGAGLARGMSTVNKKKLSHIGAAWIITPLMACAISFMIGWLFLRL